MSNGIAHMFGDYVVQTDHMARNKVRTPDSPGGAAEAALHAATYTACYVPLTRDLRALAVIGGTHYLIDRYRLAKRLVWLRNQAVPKVNRYAWRHAGVFGQPTVPHPYLAPLGEGEQQRVPTSPDWLAGWLLFLADNACHLAINEWALRRWAR